MAMPFFSFAWIRRGLGVAMPVSLALDGQRAGAGDSITFGGRAYATKGLVGVGRLAADLRDKFGETFGFGSGLAPDPKTWSLAAGAYRGAIYSARMAATCRRRGRTRACWSTTSPIGITPSSCMNLVYRVTLPN
jgi:hypothetical protein